MVLLESCGHGLLLDGGEPLSTLLIRHGTDLNEIDGIVITHLHPDHAGALPQLIQTMQISRRDKVFQVLMPSEGTHLYKGFLNMLYLFDSVLPELQYRYTLRGQADCLQRRYQICHGTAASTP